MTWSNVRCQVSGVAAAALPPLLVLYPLLLLLDDLEPGFVRSVVNPHWFLLALIVIGIVAGRDVSVSVPTPSPTSPSGLRGTSRSPSRWKGEKKGTAFLALLAAVLVGTWVWWRLQAGTLGIVVAILAAVSIAAVAWSFGSGVQSEDG